MTDFREFPDSNARQLIDYNRFMELTGNKIFICLDKGVIEIAKYLLNSRGSWRTTYVKEYVGTIGYTMPTEAEFRNVINAITEANIDMASCEDIVTALGGIQAAIEAGGAGGCGCVGEGGTDVTDVNDGASEDVPQPGGTLPPGFSTFSEFDTYRCKAAWSVFRNYVGTLRNWAGLSGLVGGLTLAVITGLLLLTVPPAGLMLILAAMGILVGVDIGLLSTLSAIADGLEADEDNIVCNIYSAATTEDAVTALRSAANDVIAGLSLGALESTFQQITSNLISNDAMAVLTTKDATINALPEEDCSECEGFAVWSRNATICDSTLVSGTFQDGQVTVVESCIGPFFGDSRAGMNFNSFPGSFYPGNRRVTITDIDNPSGHTFYVTYLVDGTSPVTNEMSEAALNGHVFSAISDLQITRPGVNDEETFTISSKAEAI